MRIALALLVACSSGGDPAPAPAHDDAVRAMATVVVSECGYTVKMPGRVKRTTDGATTRYAADGTSKIVAMCTVFPGDPPADVLRATAEHTAPGATVEVDPSGMTARYRFVVGDRRLAGRLYRAGRQVHALSADVTLDDDAGEFENVVASYKAY